MFPLRHLVIAVLLAAGLAAAAARAQQPPAAGAGGDAAIRALVARYVDAREKRDAAALTMLFTDDADQLVSSGEWRRGRDAVVQGGLASSARNSGTRTIEIETVRFLTPEIAIADGRYDIDGGNGAVPRRMWTSFVVRRLPDRWRISAIRNMRPAE